jgi:hypothetical protein
MLVAGNFSGKERRTNEIGYIESELNNPALALTSGIVY